MNQVTYEKNKWNTLKNATNEEKLPKKTNEKRKINTVNVCETRKVKIKQFL